MLTCLCGLSAATAMGARINQKLTGSQASHETWAQMEAIRLRAARVWPGVGWVLFASGRRWPPNHQRLCSAPGWLGWLLGRSLGARLPGIPAARGAILGYTALIATPTHVVESHRNHQIGGWAACREGAPRPTIGRDEATTRRIRLSRPGTARAGRILRALSKQ